MHDTKIRELVGKIIAEQNCVEGLIHNKTLLGCHREGLPGRGPQGDQELRQVLCHPQVHDLQLENKRESRDMLLPFSCRL